jgi:hypothetical protein
MENEKIVLKDLSTFIDIVKSSDKLWYRGQGDTDYVLEPSLFRHTKNASLEVFKREKEILSIFKQRSLPYLSYRIEDDFEYLFLMQHYGIPTRLLDWSENPFVALYFSLSTSLNKKCDSSFFVLNPMEWNRKLLKIDPGNIRIFNVFDPIIRKGYEISSDDFSMGYPYPTALNGNYNSQRILAQKGVFLIFGREIKSMENIYDEFFDKKPVLKKYIIENGNKKRLFDELLSIGITDAVIFPDIEGLGKEIRRILDYEVK